MAEGAQRSYDWRAGSGELIGRLDRAHSAAQDLSSALERGDEDSAHALAHSALEAVGSIDDAVAALSAQLPPEARLSEPDRARSMVAIGGSDVACVALDVMVNALLALAATDDDDDTDCLIAAYVDAASAYQVAATAVENAPKADGAAIRDLKGSFDLQGESSLRTTLTRDRGRVVEISRRLGSVLSQP